VLKGFWDWIRTEKKVIKPLPKTLATDFYIPTRSYEPKIVSQYSERELQEMYPPLKDAYEQYQILLKMYDTNHKKKFQKARSV